MSHIFSNTLTYTYTLYSSPVLVNTHVLSRDESDITLRERDKDVNHIHHTPHTNTITNTNTLTLTLTLQYKKSRNHRDI